MSSFVADFPGLYAEDIIEMVNVPYTEWPNLLSQYSSFRIKHDTEDEFGYEQVLRINEGIVVRSLDLLILRDNTVAVGSLKDYVSFYFHLNGDCTISFEDHDLPLNSGVGGFYYDRTATLNEDFSRAGTKYAYFEVLVEKTFLLNNFFSGCDVNMPALVKQIYQTNKEYIYRRTALDVETHQAFKILSATDFRGQLRDQFLDAKSKELVCLMIRTLLRDEKKVVNKPLTAKESALMEQAKQLLLQDLANPLATDEIAKSLGIGRSVLQDRFKQLFGVSLRSYLVEKRMEKAKSLLNQPDLNINQISWQLGYEHSCNFVTAFKRQYGLTPKAYRKLDVAAEQ